jgi:flavin reductase (DIM6/NTAB) family NADH-FMN oxidoreductase RutF
MTSDTTYQELSLEVPVWESFFSVFPLVLVGTREPDGGHDLAPKHLAMPMSWKNLFGFVCTPRHATYRNLQRTGEFTVSYLRPDQVLSSSLAASPHCAEGVKPALAALPVEPARAVDGVVLSGAPVQLECRLHQLVDGLDDNSLIIGRIVAARVAAGAERRPDRDDNDLVNQSPLLAYLYPFRFAVVDRSQGFPLPKGFSR